MDFRNFEALRVECELARTLGYVGKVAIHPAQVAVINEVFTPSAEVVAYQRKVLAAFEAAEAEGSASIAVDGKMVDYAVARVARAISHAPMPRRPARQAMGDYWGDEPLLLSGVTILELGQVIAGTYGGTILADMGAEVIKIEPFTGDSARNATIAPLHGESSIHLFMNRGKKSVVIDLKTARTRDLLRPRRTGRRRHRQLPPRGHGASWNRPREPETAQPVDHHRFGDRLRRNRAGQGRAAFDLVIQAFSGHVDITGPRVTRPGWGSRSPTWPGGSSPASRCSGPWWARTARRRPPRRRRHARLPGVACSHTTRWVFSTRAEVTRHGTAHAHMVPWQAFEVRTGMSSWRHVTRSSGGTCAMPSGGPI